MADYCTTPNLNELDNKALSQWISSFDHVLLDCDGVVLSGINLIPGAKEAISTLKSIGKSVHIITNNCTRNIADWQKTFEKFELEVSGADVIQPTKVAIDYLKRKNVQGELFILGCSKMQQEFADAGFALYNYVEDKRDEVWSTLDALQEEGSKIGAVIVDFDIEMTYLKLMKAYLMAKKPEVPLIFAATDKCIKYGDIWIIGPHFFQEPLEYLIEKKPVRVGKPSILYRDYLQKEYNMKPSRTLFIGDSLETDMIFASQCCFLKLLVLTGVTNKEQLDKCQGSLRPSWYLDNLLDLEKLLKK